MNYVRFEGGAKRAAKLLQNIDARIYKPVGELAVEAWRSAEPVPFANRKNGYYCRVALGERWALNRFDTAWVQFSFSGKLPAGTLFARIDLNSELGVVDHCGVPQRGLTCIRSSYEPTAGAPGKTVFQIPSEWVSEEGVLFWAEAGYNDLFGTPVGEGRVEMACLVTRDDEWRQLYYDFEVAADYFAGVPDDAPVKKRFLDLLSRWDEFGLGDIPETRWQELQRLYSTSDEPVCTQLKVSAVGHAHIDLAWLWPIRETWRKGARTFASALYNLDRYPEYIYGCSQPQLFQWMKERYPELYQAVRNKVGEGRIEPLGSFWVEPDCNLINGESLVRQIMYGKQFFEAEFGESPEFCWQPDVFGYNGQLPQILARSGHRFFMTQKLSWNLVNRFPHHSFTWEGIDGSRVLVHMLAEETYNGYAGPRSIRKIRDEYAQKEVSSHALLVYGIGDGGGGPDAEHLERLRRVGALPGFPKVHHRKVSDFFREWAQDSGAFPIWKGELYLEKHQGTFTTQGKAKRFNRLSEGMLREVEWSCTLTHFSGGMEYPTEAIREIWREVLLYQFHDILPGSSIERVYDELYPAYERLLAKLKVLSANAYQALADRIGGTLCFNSQSWAREEWIRKGRQWYRVAMPALGWGRLEAVSAEDYDAVNASDTRLENHFIKVCFASDGSITSLVNKIGGREFLPQGSQGNVLTLCPDFGDAWDFETDAEAKDPTLYLRRPREQAVLQSVNVIQDGPLGRVEQCYEIGRSRVIVKTSLEAGSPVLRFDIKTEWRNERAMLRVQFPTTVLADKALFEIPFGSIERATDEATSFHWAQFEVPALQWAALADEQGGIALLNNGKHGHRVKGGTLDLTLIRSVPHPDGAAVNPATGRAEALISDRCTDLGDHEFSYGLYLWNGSLNRGQITKAARCFNHPVHEVTGRYAVGDCQADLPEGTSFASIDHEAIEAVAVKPVEDGNGICLRLSNTEAVPITIRIEFPFALLSLTECDLLERPERNLHVEQEKWSILKFAPYEVKTLRVVPKEFRAQ